MDIILVLALLLIVGGGSGFICYYAGIHHERARHGSTISEVRKMIDDHNARMGL